MKDWVKVLSLLFSVFLMATDASSAEVKNERARQDGNRILFEYDLEGDGEAEVSISITVDGKKYGAKELHIEGDYGNVRPGNNKRIYWNVMQDFPRGLQGNFEAEIVTGGAKIPAMVFVKGGCFEMGDTFGDGDLYGSDEQPVHQVCVDDFYMGKYEVTQREWREVMGNNPSHHKDCDDCPVDQVSWDDAQEYIGKLNERNGRNYRLPTEAEWEYAARSGSMGERWAGTNNESELVDYAWFNRNSGGKTHPVGQLNANELGLYDVSGNLWEWVSDRYDSFFYKNSPKDNPSGPSKGRDRVVRGGSWSDDPEILRASRRSGAAPSGRNWTIGFRLVASPK